MVFDWGQLVLATIIYIAVLFYIAYLAEQGKIPDKILKHPLVFILAFGVCCSSWTFYGSVGMAYEIQHGYLAFYLGVSILLLFSAIIIRPLFTLAKNYQLSSLADLFAFRYRSRWVGLLTALGVFLAVMPLLALQIQAITDVIVTLDPNAHTRSIAATVSVILLYVTMLFGTRSIKPSERHPGLIFALAIESAFKLVVLLIIGVVASSEIGGGLGSMQTWANSVDAELLPRAFMNPMQWFSLLLLFVIAPLVLPHLFQILFRESAKPGRMQFITWAAPLYVFLMALPILPIMWAGVKTGSSLSPEYFTLSVGLALESPGLIWLTFIGGLSAASGVTVIAALSISSMLLNHLVLPFNKPKNDSDVYQWLIWSRRILITFVFASIFGFYVFLNQVHNQSTLLITSYSGLVQMAPGLVGLLFWSRANHKAFIVGVTLGLFFWVIWQLAPVLSDSLSLVSRLPLQFAIDRDNWTEVVFYSLSLNTVAFIITALITKPTEAEQAAAEICVISRVDRRQRLPLKAKNAREFIEALARPLGQVMAEREVQRALTKLRLDLSEYRPYALRRLRDTIEANLSGLMGPSVAQATVSHYLPYEQVEAVRSEDIHFLEQNLDNYHFQLSGMAAELDRLRRHHRETLYRLPIGVCSLTSDGEILLWNQVMTKLTNIEEEQAIGAKADSLPDPWYKLFDNFINGHDEKITIEQENPSDPRNNRWFSLHKTSFGKASTDLNEGIILLLEDETEYKRLESELVHSERLASIGQLAAGIAHEIGNPITGIDCLAQDLKYATSQDDIIDIGEQIRLQTERVTKIVRSLVNFSHSGSENGKSGNHPHSLRQIVQDAMDLLALSRDENQVHFVNKVDPSYEVICEPQRLAQVFINLLGNARDASPANEAVVVDASIEPKRETLSITVTDRGTGIAEDVIDHIFDPFFTTKEVGKGTGLGLFLSYTIVEEHYGHISVKSPAYLLEGVGTQFTIRLPLHSNTVTLGNN
ncbi:sensor histidine kinase [Reinekea thalattae]|uniref:histidine kinase n=1 Tax=Reinekea thalattae TaxID=2593301 RepID=A0A5C8ZBE5_9GAMM|nr:sensor histidine kinase [Reinekea thalattae]TXR54216.1 ATPase [Reinekea thalattae]